MRQTLNMFLLYFLSTSTFFSFVEPNKYIDLFDKNTLNTTTKQSLNQMFELGRVAYSNYEYYRAIEIWKTVLSKADKKIDSSIIIKSSINIGSSYNALGYHKTALNYFLKSDKIFNGYQIKNKNYWANFLIIGVCYMSLEQYDLAKNYFDKTIDFNNYIIFLKKLNLAKWYAVQNKQSGFLQYQQDIDKMVSSFPIYLDIWNELQLDFFIKWKNLTKVNEILVKLIPTYNQQNLHLKLLINNGYLLAKKKTFEPVAKLITYQDEVLKSNDMYLNALYYSVLKGHYLKSKNIDQYHYYTTLWTQNEEALNKEKNMLHVEDFKAAEELNELKGKFTEVQLKNQLIQNQLSKSTLLFRFSMVIIIMGIGIIFLIVRNHKKNKEINALSVIHTQNELLKKEFEKIELSENLKEREEELNTSILNIKKVALLKKQLENIVDEKNHNYNEKETLKRLKLCLNSFFDNYRELSQIMQQKLNVDKIIAFVKEQHPDITAKEISVIEFIALQFTTKEIALLMDKSEKTIEYYRSQIRKKFNLTANNTLEEYLNSLVKI